RLCAENAVMRRTRRSGTPHARIARALSLSTEDFLSLTNLWSRTAAFATACAVPFLVAGSARAQSVAVYGPETQGRADPISMIDLSVGRSLPITTPVALTKASVASPEIADLVVVSDREFVINAKAIGETDAVLWLANGTRQHLRVSVRSPSDRQQVAVYIRFAEVNRTLLRQIGVSARYRDAQGHERIGTGNF